MVEAPRVMPGVLQRYASRGINTEKAVKQTYVSPGKNEECQIVEVSLLEVGRVLRVEGDTCSVTK